MVKNRAETDAQKRWIVDRLLSVWMSKPNLRLCQLIANVIDEEFLYNKEDYELITELEEAYKNLG